MRCHPTQKVRHLSTFNLSKDQNKSYDHFFNSIRLWFPGGSAVKDLPANSGDMGSIPELGRSPGGKNDNPPQCSCLENPMDRGAQEGYTPCDHKRVRCDLVTEQQFSSVTQSCPTFYNPMNCSTPGLPIHQQLPESTQTHVHWCHPTISSSVVPFSSCLQSFPASGCFQMSQLFTSGDQSIGVSASTSVPPMNTQDWSPLGWTGWISLQSKGLSRVFSNTTVQKHHFFGTQLSL